MTYLVTMAEIAKDRKIVNKISNEMEKVAILARMAYLAKMAEIASNCQIANKISNEMAKGPF